MDFIYGGVWSTALQTKLQDWIDSKWKSWGEAEAPGSELVDFIKESLENKKKISDFVDDFLELELGEVKARELAAELADILREVDANITVPPKTLNSNPALLGALKSSREALISKPSTAPVATHAKDVSRLLNVALPSSRDGKDNHSKRERKPLQDQRKSNAGGDVYSRLGKRQHDTGYGDQSSGNAVDANAGRAAKFRHVDNDADGTPNPLRDQMKYMEEMNRVAIQSGFRNAKEMLEMTASVPAAQPHHAPPNYFQPGHFHPSGQFPPQAPVGVFPPNDYYGVAVGSYYPQQSGHVPPGHFQPGFDPAYSFQGRGGRGGRGYIPRGVPTDGATFGRSGGRFAGVGRGGRGGQTPADNTKPTLDSESIPKTAPTDAPIEAPAETQNDLAVHSDTTPKPFTATRGGGRGMSGGRFAGHESAGRGGRDSFGRGGYVPRAVMNPFAQTESNNTQNSRDSDSAVGQVAASHNPFAAPGGEFHADFSAPFRGGGRGYYGGRGPPRGYPAGAYNGGPQGGVAPGRSANKVWVRPSDVATSLVSNR